MQFPHILTELDVISVFYEHFSIFSFHLVVIGKALMPKNDCVFGRARMERKVIWSLDKGKKW